MRIMLLGYYGQRNLGDDLMLEGFLDTLCAEPSLERIIVVVKDDYFGPQPRRVTFVRTQGPAAKPRVLYHAVRSRYLVWGGGTCLYEMRSGGNPGLYGMRRIVRAAASVRTKTAFCCVGIGEMHTESGRSMIRSIMGMSSHLSFRDDESRRTAGSLLPGAETLFPGGDLVFLHPLLNEGAPRRQATESIRRIGFCGVHAYRDDTAAVAAAARNLHALSAAFGAVIVFVPLHLGAGDDHLFHRAIASQLPRGVPVEFAEYASPEKALGVLRPLDFLIGMRLHAVVLADLLGVPNIGIDYAPKVGAYVRKSGFSPEMRLARTGEAVDADRVRRIATYYRKEPERLSRFLRQERASAHEAVQRLIRHMQGVGEVIAQPQLEQAPGVRRTIR